MTNLACSLTENGILDKLARGLDSEKKSLALCLELVRLVDDESEKNALKSIIDDKERHIKIVEELIVVARNFYIGPPR